MLGILGFTSGKGGVGKTTTCINLSAALQTLGTENIIIDINLLNPNLSVQLGFQSTPITLQDVLLERVNLLQAIRIHPTGLRIIPSSLSIYKNHLNASHLRSLLKGLNQAIFLDFPPGSSNEVSNLMKVCDEILIITNPEVTAVTDAIKTIKEAKRIKKDIRGIVLNRVRNDRFELSSNDIESVCEVPIISKIPEDVNIRKANYHNMPVIFYNPISKSSIEYFKLAAMLLDKEFEPPKFLFLRRLFKIY